MDAIDLRLLDEFQRGMPVIQRPFRVLADSLGCSEGEVLQRLRRHCEQGRVARVGGTVRPNTIGASTLAALSAPTDRIDELATRICAEPGVNHCYLREHDWNLWFVATAPDAAELSALVQRIEISTGMQVLDLPLVRAFNIDLGFRLFGPRAPIGVDESAPSFEFQPVDRPLLQVLLDGLAIVTEPFAELGARLGQPEAMIRNRIAELIRSRIVTRLGVILHHRTLGFAANAMVVWKVAEDNVVAAGHSLASQSGITLCYQRRTVEGVWPYNLYCMAHARTRQEATNIVEAAAVLPALQNVDHSLLFSIRCFRQRGALIGRAA